MLEYILLAIGIVGFGLGGYWDLKYTEFPDWLPYSIISLALIFRAIFAFLLNDAWIFLSAVIVGSVFLAFGLLLYFTKQWGDGDAWFLGAMGFLFPYSGFANTILPFPVTLLFNFFIISLFYLIAYSIALGLMNPGIWKKFKAKVNKNSRIIMALTIIFFSFSWGSAIYLYSVGINSSIFTLAIFPFLLMFILLFSYYGKAIEENMFKKQVNVRDLRVGDVLVNERWKGLTEKEIGKLRKKGGKVWIKEGTRFAPVFIIALLITIFYGDLISLFLIR